MYGIDYKYFQKYKLILFSGLGDPFLASDLSCVSEALINTIRGQNHWIKVFTKDYDQSNPASDLKTNQPLSGY